MTRRLVLSLDRQCEAVGLPKPVAEYHFALPARKWRFDFCWPQFRLAVEQDGAIYSGGRHVRGSGYEKDLVKLNEALLRGWRVLRVSTGQVASGQALAWIQRALQTTEAAT